jgi:hypothetical protein
MKRRKHQIGPRVTENVHETLTRLAAAAGCSISNYTEQVLAEHVANQQRGTDEGGLRQLEQRLLEAIARVQAGVDISVKRLQHDMNAVKAMIDASVEARDPEHAEEYRALVAKILRAWGMQAGTANGGVRQ